MKFLIALTILATSATSFAQMNRTRIACYTPANQGQTGDIAYVLEERGNSLHLIFPDGYANPLRLDEEGCLEHPSQGPGPSNEVTFCRTTGQRINGLVPVEVTPEGEDEETVYCERRILNWFEDN